MISESTSDILWASYELSVGFASIYRKAGDTENANRNALLATETMQRIAELEIELKDLDKENN